MRNKLKIAAVVVAIIVGMVIYKERFERKGTGKSNRNDDLN